MKYGFLTLASAIAISMPAAAEDALGSGADIGTGTSATEAQQSYDTGTGTGMDSPEVQTDAMNVGETAIEDMDFSALDVDGDGLLTEEEFLENNQDLADAGDIFSEIDEDADGAVTEQEFEGYAQADIEQTGNTGSWFNE